LVAGCCLIVLDNLSKGEAVVAQTYTEDESRLLNETVFEKLASDDQAMFKEAVDAVNDFTRRTMREEGILRRVMPPIPIQNSDLDRLPMTDKPAKVVDMEPGSPAAVTVPFGTLPKNFYIRGRRYVVMFDRIQTRRFVKDVDELRTYMMDIRSIVLDNAIKDMMAEEDRKFFSAVDTILVGLNTANASGVAQYQSIGGNVTRDSLWDAFKIMPSTPSNFEVHTCVINNITIKEFAKFQRGEMGGNLSEEVMRNGWSQARFMGVDWIVTIKRNLVPNNHLYMFADPKVLGKHYQLEDTTMHIERNAYLIEFFAYETVGATLGHSGGLAHAVFT